MFTNNFINYMTNTYFSDVSSNSTKFAVTKPNGNSINIYPYYLNMKYNLRMAMLNVKCCNIASDGSVSYGDTTYGYGIWLGSGNTKPTKSDYTLEAPITAGLSITQPSNIVKTSKDGNYEYSSTFAIKNTTSQEITVGEIGLFLNLPISSTTANVVLMERQVFSEPLIVQPNEFKVITYMLSFNQEA